MPKLTDVKLDLISDIDFNQFIEKAMRRRVNYIAQRYSKANNKYKNFLIKINHLNVSYMKMQIIWRSQQCFNIFLLVGLSG